MIVFDLRSGEGHTFEEWFASSSEFEVKAAEEAIFCPECGDTHITKSIMAPRVNGGAAAPAAAATPCGLPACAGGTCAMMD